jgi:hypothetical protein
VSLSNADAGAPSPSSTVVTVGRHHRTSSGPLRRVGLVLSVTVGLLSACSSGNGSSTPTTVRGSINGRSTSTTARGSVNGSSTSTTVGGSGNGNSTQTAVPGSLNVSPCNYAQAWHEDPTQFSEFAVLARLADKATDSSLRDDGHLLDSDLATADTATIDDVTGSIFAVCRQLGLVRADSGTPPTSG